MAETPTHRQNLTDSIAMIDAHFATDPAIYVSGNMFLYYVPGDKRRHVSPDVFVTRGVPRDRPRDVYKTWEEGKGPDLVIELTSKSTRREDLKTKFQLYRDTLNVREYFLFDPYSEYLQPPLQGFRLVEGQYRPIEPVAGRLPSAVLGLHFERDGTRLRLYDPAAGRWLLTPKEAAARAEAERQRAEAERQRAEAERQRAEAERQRAELAWNQAEEARRQAIAENERLRRQLEDLRRLLSDHP